MSTISGRLVVNTINGKFGTFNVGTLYSSMGDYVVKYDGLDEFNEGSYDGQFIVRRIYQKTRKFRVGIIIEPVVEIEGVMLDEVYEGNQDDLPDAIPDPIEEEMEASGSSLGSGVSPDESVSSEEPVDRSLETLFGGVWPLGDIVKLDPTVGRVTFREQRDYLNDNGYEFDSMKQIWVAKD